MCINPITIPTRSHTLRVDGFKSLYITVPCGHCLQCREKNSISWATRSALEYERCIKEGGYCLFDTLTYDDDNVPRYWQFIPESYYHGMGSEMTFNKKHVQKFLKRLRIKMFRLGYDAKEKFRYMVCSEYGTDPTKTHRPHYHLYFYVNNGIPPLELSRLIADTWPYGRTDGVPFKHPNYVLNGRVFNSLTEHGLNAARYVQKYISKGSPYDRKVIRDCYIMMESKYVKEQLDWNERAILKKWIRIVSSWHIQSNQFGYFHPKIACIPACGDARKTETKSPSAMDAMRTSPNSANFVAIERSDGYKMRLPYFGRSVLVDMPRYYEDKFFREDVKTYGSTVRKFKKGSEDYVYSRMVRFISSVLRMYQNLCESDKIEVNKLFGKRSIFDFAVYKVCYQGRLGTPSGDYVADYLRSKFSDDGFNDGSHPLFVYACPNDIFRFDRAVCSFKYLGNSSRSHRERGVPLDIFPLNQVRCIDHTFKDFYNFDLIDDILQAQNLQDSVERELELHEKERCRYKYKKCGMLK